MGFPQFNSYPKIWVKWGKWGEQTQANQEEKAGARQKTAEDSNFGGLKPQRRENRWYFIKLKRGSPWIETTGIPARRGKQEKRRKTNNESRQDLSCGPWTGHNRRRNREKTAGQRSSYFMKMKYFIEIGEGLNPSPPQKNKEKAVEQTRKLQII